MIARFYKLFGVTLLLVPGVLCAQQYSPNDPYSTRLRDAQLSGYDIGSHSLLLRTNTYGSDFARNTLLSGAWVRQRPENPWTRIVVRPMAPNWEQIINTDHPTGYNLGSMFASKGYSTRFTAGVFAEAGPLSVQIQPEILYNANREFMTFPHDLTESQLADYYRELIHRIDMPERYRPAAFSRILPGNSSIRLNLWKISLGVSNEYLWWGPGQRNSIMLSSNSEGFNHITLNTNRPIRTWIGKFEGQYLMGRLEDAGYIVPPERLRQNGNSFIRNKVDEWRYLNAIMMVWHPPFTDGFYLGAARTFIGYSGQLDDFWSYHPLFQPFTKDRFMTEDNVRGNDQYDQRLSGFFRWVFPVAHFEVYGEYAREDHSADIRDIIAEPEHSRAFSFGVRKLWYVQGGGRPGTGAVDRSGAPNPNRIRLGDGQGGFQSKLCSIIGLCGGDPAYTYWSFSGEITQVGNTNTQYVRPSPSWYVHHIVRQGYTHRGQLIGAGIGPGGGSIWMALERHTSDLGRIGFEFERLVHNRDLHREIFGNIADRRYISYMTGLHADVRLREFLVGLSLQRVQARNRHYHGRIDEETGKFVGYDPVNYSLGFRVRYILR